MSQPTACPVSFTALPADQRRAFTLIELLVVIGIIAILMAMLLPALQDAKERGKRTDCINKLRQFMVATHMYVEDYDEYLLRMKNGTDNFTDLLAPYLSSVDYDQMWLCGSGDENAAPRDSANGMVLHYGINNYDYDDVDGDGIDNHCSGMNNLKTVQIADPQSVIYMADGDPTSSPEDIGGAQNGTTDWPLTSLSESRHANGYNAAVAAGSVKWYNNVPNHATGWAIRRK